MTVIWRPSRDFVEHANITRFMRAHGISTDAELRDSALDIEWFWDAVVQDLEIDFSEPYKQVLDASRGPEWSKWFVGGMLNLAHNCVDRWAERKPGAVALIWEGEDGQVRQVTFSELRALSNRAANALRGLGVGPRDVVGLYMPMAPETVAVMYACAKLGAVALPIFSGFGPEAVATRLLDAKARILVTADGFLRQGSTVPMKEVANEAADRAPSIRKVLVWRRLSRKNIPWVPERDIPWEEAVAGQSDIFPTEPFESEHPVLLAYTSGTTGRPKGAVHVHGGLLVNVAKDAAYQLDLRQRDTLFWVTDLGWIMGPWEFIAAGVLGASVFMYEGAPTQPRPDRLWNMVERHGITILGVGPSLIRGLAALGTEHVRSHDLSSLRILGATGEPWNQEPYLWLFNEVGGGRCPIINISGGTETGGAFLAPLPIMELKPCTLGGPALGMDVDVFGADGHPIPRGQMGELVCKKPWPAMTRGIWGDPERYLETYWSRWPGVWVHGDWASVDEDGFWFLHGRSDDTLNIAGKRLGPAEVESVLTDHPAVAESAAIGVPHEVKGEAIWCFVIPQRGQETGPDLAEELTRLVAERLGKPFRPERLVFVNDLPRTRSAKILRRVIRATVLGQNPGDVSAMEDASSLQAIREALP